MTYEYNLYHPNPDPHPFKGFITSTSHLAEDRSLGIGFDICYLDEGKSVVEIWPLPLNLDPRQG